MKWINQTNQASAALQVRFPAPSEGGDVRTIQLQPGNGAYFPFTDFYIYFPNDTGLAEGNPEYVYISTRSADTLFAGPDPFGISSTTGRGAINPGRWPGVAHSVGARLELRNVGEIIKQLQNQVDGHTHDGTTGNGSILTEIAGVANVVLTNATGGSVSAGDVLVRSGNSVILPATDGVLSNVITVVADPTGATPDVSTYTVVNGSPVNTRCVGLVPAKLAVPCAQGSVLRVLASAKMSPATSSQTGVVAIAEQDSNAYSGGHWAKVFLHNRGVDVVTLAGSQELTNKKLTQPAIYTGSGSGTLVTFPNTVSASTLVDTATAQNLTAKTLVSPVVQVGSDAPGDTYYRTGGGALGKVDVGVPEQVYTLNGSNVPSWATVPRYTSTNMVTNGDFRIQQRGASFTAPINADYLADNWMWYQALGSPIARVQMYDGIQVASGVPTTSVLNIQATGVKSSLVNQDMYAVMTKIEGYDIGAMSAGASLSFWQYTTIGGKNCVALRNAATNRNYIIEYTLTPNAWTRVTAVIPPLPSGTWNFTNGLGLTLTWTIAAGASWFSTANTWGTSDATCTSSQVNNLNALNNVFALANVNLIPGAAPREIQPRSIADELDHCRRYYQRLLDQPYQYFCAAQAITGNTVLGQKEFTTPMRVAPTIRVRNPTSISVNLGNGTGVAATAIFTDFITVYNMRVLATVSGGLTTGDASTIISYNGSGIIEASAEM